MSDIPPARRRSRQIGKRLPIWHRARDHRRGGGSGPGLLRSLCPIWTPGPLLSLVDHRLLKTRQRCPALSNPHVRSFFMLCGNQTALSDLHRLNSPALTNLAFSKTTALSFFPSRKSAGACGFGAENALPKTEKGKFKGKQVQKRKEKAL